MDLKDIRAQIDAIDDDLVELFKKRIECAIMMQIAEEEE